VLQWLLGICGVLPFDCSGLEFACPLAFLTGCNKNDFSNTQVDYAIAYTEFLNGFSLPQYKFYLLNTFLKSFYDASPLLSSLILLHMLQYILSFMGTKPFAVN
jgi:hypothetical protein